MRYVKRNESRTDNQPARKLGRIEFVVEDHGFAEEAGLAESFGGAAFGAWGIGEKFFEFFVEKLG